MDVSSAGPTGGYLTVGTPMPISINAESKVDALFNALKAHGLVCYVVNADGSDAAKGP